MFMDDWEGRGGGGVEDHIAFDVDLSLIKNASQKLCDHLWILQQELL